MPVELLGAVEYGLALLARTKELYFFEGKAYSPESLTTKFAQLISQHSEAILAVLLLASRRTHQKLVVGLLTKIAFQLLQKFLVFYVVLGQ